MDTTQTHRGIFPPILWRVRMLLAVGLIAGYILYDAFTHLVHAWIPAGGVDRFLLSDAPSNSIFGLVFVMAMVSVFLNTFHGTQLRVHGGFLTIFSGKRRAKFEIESIRKVETQYYRGVCQLIEIRESRWGMPDIVEPGAEFAAEVTALEQACREHAVPFRRKNHLLNPQGLLMGFAAPIASGIVAILVFRYLLPGGFGAL